jgi:hypothetical protein
LSCTPVEWKRQFQWEVSEQAPEEGVVWPLLSGEAQAEGSANVTLLRWEHTGHTEGAGGVVLTESEWKEIHTCGPEVLHIWRLEISHTAGGVFTNNPFWRTAWQELFFVSKIQILWIYSEKIIRQGHKDVHTDMFSTAVFTLGNNLCVQHFWLIKPWCIHTMEFCTAITTLRL